MNSHPKSRLVIGTRGSELALRQAQFIADRLIRAGAAQVELQVIKTKGDRDITCPFPEMEGTGFFTREIEHALLGGSIDLAVHSLKDLPTTLPAGLQMTAVPDRANPRDLMLIRPEAVDHSRKIGLKLSAVVGTSSIRRVAQLVYHRPDLLIRPLRGNVNTRIEKLRQREYDAIVVAAAGIYRLGLTLDGLELLELHEHLMVPAPAQGALAVETRSADHSTNALVAEIDDVIVRLAVETEREVLRQLGGGCHLPLGVLGKCLPDGFRVTAFLGIRSEVGWGHPRRIAVSARTPNEAVGTVVEYLRGELSSPSGKRFRGKTVLVTRALTPESQLCRQVESAGGRIIGYPTLKAAAAGDAHEIGRALARLKRYDWLVFSSSNGVTVFFDLLAAHHKVLSGGTRVAVMGRGTKGVFESRASRAPDFVPTVSTGEGLAEEFGHRYGRPGLRVLLPTTAERNSALEQRLGKQGIVVDPLVIYTTVSAGPKELPTWDGRADAVIFTSGKAARFFLELAELPLEARVISIGPTTTATLVELNISPVFEPLDHDLEGVGEVLDVVLR